MEHNNGLEEIIVSLLCTAAGISFDESTQCSASNDCQTAPLTTIPMVFQALKQTELPCKQSSSLKFTFHFSPLISFTISLSQIQEQVQH